MFPAYGHWKDHSCECPFQSPAPFADGYCSVSEAVTTSTTLFVNPDVIREIKSPLWNLGWNVRLHTSQTPQEDLFAGESRSSRL